MTSQAFRNYLQAIADRHQTLFFDRCDGNNGDDLITLGAEELIKSTGVRTASDPSSADVILINGGGMFVEGFVQGLAKVQQYTDRYPSKPLCIGPQSFALKSDALRKLVAGRRSILTVVTREDPSAKSVRAMLERVPNVEFLDDHDLAFYIPQSSPIFVGSERKLHKLVVERMDSEHRTLGSRYKNSTGGSWSIYHNMVPQSAKNLLRPLRVWMRSKVPTEFMRFAKREIDARFPEFRNLPYVAKDISRKDIASREEFVDIIAGSACVFTDRLHVGILAGRMGKPTFLFEGSYHKCRGIYERSMKGLSNVTLVHSEA